ncbi:hypothetical protein BST30_08925 [Mycobacterium mantenii]|uniref:Uncharacterized protein n=1 Tax=Mycobacterium mantenii TaxID=560555 RepID=A0A1X0G0I6_MYCNT|nr:hypothetical protein BST30_08925 [Mycobacterium mantenii]
MPCGWVARSAKNAESLGTTMKMSSQIQSVDASAPAIPERVSVAMAETCPAELSTGIYPGRIWPH